MHHTRGFTLIELLLVVSIIGVIATAVIPAFAGTLRSVRTRDAADSLLATLQYAQARAVTDALEYRVYLDEKQQAYWVARAAADVDGERYFEVVTERNAEAVALPKTLRFDEVDTLNDRRAEAAFVRFLPSGVIAPAEFTLRIEGRQRRAYTYTAGGTDIRMLAPES